MGVLEIRGGLDLGEEALRAHQDRQLGLQHLQSDLPLVPLVVGQVDRSHPALAELSLDSVAALEGRVQSCDRVVGHGRQYPRGDTRGAR